MSDANRYEYSSKTSGRYDLSKNNHDIGHTGKHKTMYKLPRGELPPTCMIHGRDHLPQYCKVIVNFIKVFGL